MALVAPEAPPIGSTELSVDVRGNLEPAEVVPLPFYRRPRTPESGEPDPGFRIPAFRIPAGRSARKPDPESGISNPESRSPGALDAWTPRN